MGQDPDPCTAEPKRADDVGLEPQVHDRDPRPRLVRIAVIGNGRRGDLADEVLVLPACDASGGDPSSLQVQVAGRGDDAAQTPAGAQMASQAARIDACDGRDIRIAQERGQLASAVRYRRCRVRHHERPQPRADGLVVI